MKKIFYNTEEARIRALWRILLQAVIAAGLAAVFSAGAVSSLKSLYSSGSIPLEKELFDMLVSLLGGLLFTVGMLLSLKISGKYLDKRKFKDFGYELNSRWFKQCLYGLLLGALLMSAVFVVELAAGLITIDKYFYSGYNTLPVVLVFAYPVIKMICIGIYEESLSRGYHLTNIQEGFTGVGKINSTWAGAIAVFITSAMFGLFHLGNPNATLFGVLNTVVAGVLLGAAFVITKQLAMPIGIHISWNLFQGLVFGFPVSGEPEKARIISTVHSGPEWLTGGNYGPEAGLIGLIAILAGILILFFYHQKLKKIQLLTG
jgi:membrane protease YdiL (CAAX protease family)